jgi:two-component system, LytTR family, response regulator
VKNSTNITPTFTIHTTTGIYFIEPNTIIRCQASSNYTRIYFTNAKPILLSKTLGKCQLELHNENFIRVHQSHLINKNYIDKICKNEVTLKNGNTILISRRKKKIVNIFLQNSFL